MALHDFQRLGKLCKARVFAIGRVQISGDADDPLGDTIQGSQGMFCGEAPPADSAGVDVEFQLIVNASTGLENLGVLSGVAASEGRREDFFGTLTNELFLPSASAAICEGLIDGDVAPGLIFDEENHVRQRVEQLIWQQQVVP